MAVGPAALADTIRLKNGRAIAADSVREANGRIEYTIGDSTFTISKSLVEKIEAGPPAGAPAPSAPGEKSQSPAADIPQVREPAPAGNELTARILHDGQIDLAALKAIEDEGLAEKSALANYLAAAFAEKQNNLPLAAHYFDRAVAFTPTQPVLLDRYTSVLLQLGKYSDALSFAGRAARAAPESADTLALLGYAYYKNDRNRDALDAWKKSMALRPDPSIQQLMARVEREAKAEAEFRQQESSHFVLHYEGSQAPDSLRRAILDTLEEQYNALAGDLGASPRDTISVSLYTGETYFDVTQAPSWSAALNDGKIRIPISGVAGVTPELAHVLKHELTHSFIAQITHGHVPQWLNEGMAQLEEARTTAPMGGRLASLYASGNQIPLNQLEGSFQTYSSGEASVAYSEALAAVEYLRATYGMGDLARILQRLGAGESMETALRGAIHGGYAQLESEIANYLKHAYGT